MRMRFFVFTQLGNLFIFRRARILTFVNISHLKLCKYQKNALAFASITELRAQKARTLWGNLHLCTKLFNMLISGADGTSDENRRTRHRALEESAYANSHEWRSAQLIAQVCAGHYVIHLLLFIYAKYTTIYVNSWNYKANIHSLALP